MRELANSFAYKWQFLVDYWQVCCDAGRSSLNENQRLSLTGQRRVVRLALKELEEAGVWVSCYIGEEYKGGEPSVGIVFSIEPNSADYFFKLRTEDRGKAFEFLEEEGAA
jgi:hypothetical protein